MRIFFLIIAVAIATLACQQTKKIETAAVVDSVSAGKGEFILDSLLKYSTEADIIRDFGSDNITRDTAYYPEGEGQYVITLLFPESEKEVEFTWNDTINFSSLSAVTLHRKGSVWKSSEGITIGTTMTELADLNKKDIEFSGLEWDYGGVVFWNEGLLQTRSLSVILGLPENLDTTLALDSILGDQRIVSSAAIAKKINPVVVELSLMKQHE